MSLPGKLTVGFLHEDNPIKSFFRMKPLLTEVDGQFVPSDMAERFPEDGFIRIVPDKNEIAIFKPRMYQMGRYCALDLRKHLSESDKIRPNKNYIFGGPERNQSIVYSDVIGRLPLHLIAEVVDASTAPGDESAEEQMERPGTPYVLLRHEGMLTGPWSWEINELHPGTVKLKHAEQQPFSEHPDSILEGKSIQVPLDEDSSVLLLHDLSPFNLVEVTMPEIERMSSDVMPGSTASSYRTMDTYQGMEATISQQLQSKAADAPWLVKSEVLRPRVVNNRLSLREQALQAQSGYNPRRGRSLHEVVDEQWRKSRFDQLGHPVPTQAMGRPIASPIERASASVNDAWALPDGREALMDELLKNSELQDALLKRLDRPAQSGAASDGRLNDMEASRLTLIGEIDALRKQRDETKNALLEELRSTNKQELSQYEQRTSALKSELAQNEQAAQSANEASKLAQSMLDATLQQLDERLMSSFIGQRAVELARHTQSAHVVAGHPETYEPSAGELISDVRVRMQRAGFELTNDEAVNLLACMMSGGTLILSGASGSGKSELARRLADALGLRGESNRFVEVRSPAEEDVCQLLRSSDGITQLMVLLDDFNTGDCERRMLDILELQEKAAAENLPLNLFLTAQDAPEGSPMPARLLSRSFLIRLRPAGSSASWRPSDRTQPAPDQAVSLMAMQRIFRRDQELPAEVVERLQKLRDGLDKFGYSLDRRTLNELWYFCSAARPLMQCTGLELLDMALSQRAVPAMLASMELHALHELPKLLVDMPRCLSLMDQPLPLPPL